MGKFFPMRTRHMTKGSTDGCGWLARLGADRGSKNALFRWKGSWHDRSVVSRRRICKISSDRKRIHGKNGKITAVISRRMDSHQLFCEIRKGGLQTEVEKWNRINRYCVLLRIDARELKPGSTDYGRPCVWSIWWWKIFGMGSIRKNLNKKVRYIGTGTETARRVYHLWFQTEVMDFLNNPAIGTAIFGANKTDGMQRAQRNWIILSRREYRLRLKNSYSAEEHRWWNVGYWH